MGGPTWSNGFSRLWAQAVLDMRGAGDRIRVEVGRTGQLWAVIRPRTEIEPISPYAIPSHQGRNQSTARV